MLKVLYGPDLPRNKTQARAAVAKTSTIRNAHLGKVSFSSVFLYQLLFSAILETNSP